MKRNLGRRVRPHKVRILLYDVESFPNLAWIWGKWEQNAVGDFIRERMVVCFSYKWLGEKKVYHVAMPMFGLYKRNRFNNRMVMRALHRLIAKADITVAHNGDRFDDKMSNTEFFKLGMTPPPPHRTIDTLKVARMYFAFNSNKLDDLGHALGLGRKVHTGGFKLWVDCMDGKPKAWKKMRVYNDQDVVLLEKVLLRERPWIKNYPQLGEQSSKSCPACGGKLINRGWVLVTNGRRRKVQCRECGHWPKGKLYAR